MKYQIFIDMDGVFVDFLGGCFDWFEPEDKTMDDWPTGVWGDDKLLKEMFGYSGNMFWRMLNEYFWSNLKWQPDGKDFIKYISPFKPVILTSPAYKSATGKQIWIRNNVSEYYKDRRYLIGPAKKYIARPNAILIDDCDKNIEDWVKAGGVGILYPRKWNRFHKIADDDSLDFVISYVEMLTNRRCTHGLQQIGG